MTNNMFQTYFIIRRINTCLSIRLLIDHEYIYGIQEKNYEADLDRVSVFIKRQETIKYHVFSDIMEIVATIFFYEVCIACAVHFE